MERGDEGRGDEEDAAEVVADGRGMPLSARLVWPVALGLRR